MLCLLELLLIYVNRQATVVKTQCQSIGSFKHCKKLTKIIIILKEKFVINLNRIFTAVKNFTDTEKHDNNKNTH
jgi:hypothetical protein